MQLAKDSANYCGLYKDNSMNFNKRTLIIEFVKSWAWLYLTLIDVTAEFVCTCAPIVTRHPNPRVNLFTQRSQKDVI